MSLEDQVAQLQAENSQLSRSLSAAVHTSLSAQLAAFRSSIEAAKMVARKAVAEHPAKCLVITHPCQQKILQEIDDIWSTAVVTPPQL